MDQVFTDKDLESFDYIPQNKRIQLTQDLNRLIRQRVTNGQDDKVWHDFVQSLAPEGRRATTAAGAAENRVQ